MTDTRNLGYQKLISRFKFFLSRAILAKREKKKSIIKLIDNNKSNSTNNIIIKDISNIKCASYKLRIYKKFITRNSLFSSAIVYNFLLKTLRFMTKGSPEKILPHCITSSLPGDIYKTISNFRKDGYIIIICASKKIDLYSYKESRDESYYLRDLIFCGLITLKNKIKKESKKFINELEKLNCQLIMNTGDNVYNSMGTGFETGLLDNTKKLFVLDLDESKKQIYITNIYRPPEFDYEILDKIEEKRKKMKRTKIMKKIRKTDLSMAKKIREDNTSTSIQTQNPSSLDKNDSRDNRIKSNKKGSVMSRQTLNQYKYLRHNKNINSKDFLLSSRNEDSELISEKAPALRKVPTINNSGNESKIKISNKKLPLYRKFESGTIGNSSSYNKSNALLSPRSNKKSNNELNSKISLEKSNKIKNISLNVVKIEKTYSFENSKKNIYYNTSFIEFESEDFEKEEFMKEYFSNICYYSKSILKNIENNSILCISGKALKFIYENKNDNQYSLLLKLLSENTKIFFSMTSEDKSFLIDYYRELPDKMTCMIGYGTSDIDSMMTAHVGVTIKKPTNINMILSHFYLPSKNLIHIKTIIEHGRVILENFMLLFFSCLFCTTIINIYMSMSFYILLEIKPEILRTLNLIFYFLCLFGFTSSVDNNANNSLMRNSQFFWKYIIVHIIGNIIIKTYDVIIFCYIYRKNSEIEENRRNDIYISYFSILSFNQIFTTLFGFNFIRFYRRSIVDNFLFTFSLIIFFFLILVLSCLSRIGLFEEITHYYSFERMKIKSDTFDDRNKLVMFIIILIDLFSTFLFILVTQYIFNKKADNSLHKIKKNIN
jgi:magnesium-transporting ATPase (P-type)